MGVPGKTEGTIFSPIPCDVILSGPERVGGEIIQFTAVEVNGKGLTRKMLVCIVDFLSAIDNQIFFYFHLKSAKSVENFTLIHIIH